MQRYKIPCFVLILALLQVACTNQTTLPDIKPISRSNTPLANISLFVAEPENADRNYFGYIVYIRESVKKSGIFNAVDISELNERYRVRMVFERQVNDSQVGVFGQLLSAATLFLIPAKADTTYSLTVSVFDGNNLLNEFNYEDRTESYTSIVTLGDDFELQELDKLLQYFYRDIQQANILPVY